jgi:hypothetical protein
MKGVVFNLLERVVTEKYGEEAWDSLLDATGQEGAYTAVGSYADEDFLSLVGAASAELEVPADDLVRWFGRSSLPLLRDKYPAFFDHDSTRSFILTLNDVIHPEVRKLFPGARPRLRFRLSGRRQGHPGIPVCSQALFVRRRTHRGRSRILRRRSFDGAAHVYEAGRREVPHRVLV